MGVRGQRFIATNVPLSALLTFAFTPQGGRLRREQIVGLPDWGNSDTFDVEAVSPDIAQSKVLLQSLLEDRFHLKFHRETRDLPVYDLVLNKRGPKLSEDQTPPGPHAATISFGSSPEPAAQLPRGAAHLSTGTGVMTLAANSITTATLLDLLQGQADRIVFDRTELKDRFNVDLEFAPARASTTESTAASIFTAIQEQGFRLDPAKEPVEVIVIDSAQKPSSN
jgi:uncharacterized protein (TIGR03435 family)